MTRRGVVVAALIVACAPFGWWLGQTHPELSGVEATPTPTLKGAVVGASHELVLPACKEEDSDNCIWDAPSRGNHDGSSFIAYHGDIYYLDYAEDLWASGEMPAVEDLPVCADMDSESCYYPGIEEGELCNWVNGPEAYTTWFFDCLDPAMNGRKDGGV